jgi:hypothetical protein
MDTTADQEEYGDDDEVKSEHAISEISEEVSESSSTANPRLHLVHNGKFIPKEYKIGRVVKYTGIWTCCGAPIRHSLYCESDEVRAAFGEELRQVDINKRKAEEYAKMVAETRRIPWEARANTEDGKLIEDDSEQKALQDTDSPESAYNILMLVSWVSKSLQDEPTALKGMNLVHAHSLSGEGCIQLYRHGGVKLLLDAAELYRSIEGIQLACISTLRQLVDCNFTRDAVLADPTIVTTVFGIGHRYMTNHLFIEHSTRFMMQGCRLEPCRQEILDKRLLSYSMIYCQKYSKNPAILRSVLKSFNWISSTPERVILMYDAGAAKTIIQCMRRHMANPDILAPSMLYLTRVSGIHPPALSYLVKKHAVPLVIGALKALYSEEVIQLEALRMLQALSKSEEGWRQISETRGGWQSICQGTTQGNALVHDLKGSLHNPGWCIGETPHLPMVERSKLAAARATASKGTVIPKGAWTAHSLRQFMGLSMKPQRLSVNVEDHNVKFSLIKSLDLLPNSGEEREDWFIRIKQYEKDNNIQIDDMVRTVLEMTKKEAREERLAMRAEESGEYIKPVYVMGKRISTKALEEADIDVTAALSGVV